MRTLSVTFFTIIFCLLLKNAQGDMSLDESKTIKSVTKASTVMDSLSWIAYAAYSFFSPGDPSIMVVMSLNRMFEYAKFVNTGYPIEAQYMFYLQGFDVGLKPGIITDLQTESVKYFKNSQMTGTAFGFYLFSTSFFINFFPNLLKLLVLGILLAALFFLIKCFARDPEEDSKLRSFMKLLKWNVFILIMFSMFLEITLFSVLELRSANFANFFSVISFFVCAIIIVIALTFFGRLVQITLAFRKVYNNKMTSQNHAQEMSELMAKWEGYKPYFGIYKRSFLTQGHLFIFIVRIVCFSFFLGTLFEYPVVQSVFFMLMTLAMIAYLIIMRPYIKMINFIGQMVMEILLFIYYILVLALAVKDSKKELDLEGREKIGTVLIAFSILAQIFTLLFVVLKALLLGKQLYLKWNSQEKVPMDVEADLKQDKTIQHLNNSHMSGKNLITGVNDSVISRSGDFMGAGGDNKDATINILDQSGANAGQINTENANNEQDNLGPGLSREEIAVIEARKRYLIEQSRGLYTRQAQKSRRPKIVRPRMQSQPPYQPQLQLQLQNNLNGNLMNNNGNYGNMNVVNNNGDNGNVNMMNHNGSYGNMSVMNYNSNSHENYGTHTNMTQMDENINMMSNHNGSRVNMNRNRSVMINHNENNGRMNMNRNLNNNFQRNPYPRREGNLVLDGN